MGGREYQDYPSKIFCLTVAKNFVGQPFSVSLISGIGKFYASEGYVTVFCRKFLSHSAEKIRRRTLLCSVSEKFCQRKILWIREWGKYKDIQSKIFCLTAPKKFVWQLFGVPLISGIEKFYAS